MPTDKELLIKDLMHKCDCLYRENSRLKEMVSTQPLKAADKEVYEALLSDKDAIIAQKEAKINSLEQRVSYLERQLYGKKAEKFIKPDAQDRWLDFEGFDMLPQEAEAAEEAEKELKATREAIIARKKAGKQHPARKSLPENLEREVVHIYPEGYNPEEWTLLPGEEVTEILMHEPEKFYIRRIVRHTAKRVPVFVHVGAWNLADTVELARHASRHANSKELCLCLIAGRHDDREICGSHTVPQATGTVQTCGGTSPRVNGQRLVQGCGGFAKAPLLPIMGAGDAD